MLCSRFCLHQVVDLYREKNKSLQLNLYMKFLRILSIKGVCIAYSSRAATMKQEEEKESYCVVSSSSGCPPRLWAAALTYWDRGEADCGAESGWAAVRGEALVVVEGLIAGEGLWLLWFWYFTVCPMMHDVNVLMPWISQLSFSRMTLAPPIIVISMLFFHLTRRICRFMSCLIFLKIINKLEDIVTEN